MAGSDLGEADAYHVPVLCKAVLEGLITDASGTYVDGTVGGGGHALALLNALESAGRLIGIDQDPDALAECGKRFEHEPRMKLVQGNFGDLGPVLSQIGVTKVHGVLLDLGVSSHQIDTADRGFSYRLDGPLDMRMDPSEGRTASDVVNDSSEHELAEVLRSLGEEPRSRKIAASIVGSRPLRTTRELADAVTAVLPARDHVKSLSRVFQAIRISINRELDALERALSASVDLLLTGGRIAVISYHSLEDRRVKHYLRAGNFSGKVDRDVFGNPLAPFRLVTRRAVVADPDEAKANPRSRSARLRIAERTET